MTENDHHDLTPQPPSGQFLGYEAEDGQIKIDVRLEGEMVWLPQLSENSGSFKQKEHIVTHSLGMRRFRLKPSSRIHKKLSKHN